MFFSNVHCCTNALLLFERRNIDSINIFFVIYFKNKQQTHIKLHIAYDEAQAQNLQSYCISDNNIYLKSFCLSQEIIQNSSAGWNTVSDILAPFLTVNLVVTLAPSLHEYLYIVSVVNLATVRSAAQESLILIDTVSSKLCFTGQR